MPARDSHFWCYAEFLDRTGVSEMGQIISQVSVSNLSWNCIYIAS